MKKTRILVSLLLSALFFSTNVLAQDLQKLSILKADTTYGKEIIKLPVDWAPGMTLKGYEELRFSPGWSDSTSTGFWSYVLAWDVKATAPLSSEVITTNLERYFDGLMKPNNWATTFPEPVVFFTSSEEDIKKTNTLQGHMKYFDGFHTGKMITTHIVAEQTFCTATNRTIVLFRISPKAFDHPVWNELKNVTKKEDSCVTTKS